MTLDKLTDEALAFLDSLRQRGIVGALGTGTSYANTLAIREKHREFFDVWQYSWSAMDLGQEPVQKFTITHRAIQRSFAPLRQWLSEKAERMRRFSDAAGLDLSTEDNLVKALVGAAMANNPEGITLVASRQKRRVIDHARLMEDAGLVMTGRRLIDALATAPDFARLRSELFVMLP